MLQIGKRDVKISNLETVGNYAVQPTFSDGHSTGIYSWEGGAAGVMMIPIPRRGIYDALKGRTAAQSVPGVTGVVITVEPGQIIAPPPDGSSYLGFIFARAASPADAETALHIAHRRLHFDIRPEYSAMETHAAESFDANRGDPVSRWRPRRVGH